MVARYLQGRCNSRRRSAAGRLGRRGVAGLGGVARVGAAFVAPAGAVHALVEDAVDGLLGVAGEVALLGGGGHLVVEVLVVGERLVEPVADAVGLALVETGIGHGVDDVAALGVVAGAGRQEQAGNDGERDDAVTADHGTEHLVGKRTGRG